MDPLFDHGPVMFYLTGFGTHDMIFIANSQIKGLIYIRPKVARVGGGAVWVPTPLRQAHRKVNKCYSETYSHPLESKLKLHIRSCIQILRDIQLPCQQDWHA